MNKDQGVKVLILLKSMHIGEYTFKTHLFSFYFKMQQRAALAWLLSKPRMILLS